MFIPLLFALITGLWLIHYGRQTASPGIVILGVVILLIFLLTIFI